MLSDKIFKNSLQEGRCFSLTGNWKMHSKSAKSDQISRSVVSDSLQPHESQHARPPCPSPTPEFTQTHIHQVSDAIQPSHPLSSPSPLAPNPSQHQSLFQWVNSSHEVLNKVPQKKLISLYVPNIFRPHLKTIYIYIYIYIWEKIKLKYILIYVADLLLENRMLTVATIKTITISQWLLL